MCRTSGQFRQYSIRACAVKVLTAAVLQLFLEVRQALGEPGIGLPRQIWAAT